jgi:Fe-S cluster biosynthesis and repair protein YggX
VLKQAALGNWQKETTILAAEHVLVMEYSELREQMMERLGEKISIPIAVACACKPLD